MNDSTISLSADTSAQTDVPQLNFKNYLINV